MKKFQEFKGLMFAFSVNNTKDNMNKTQTFGFDGFIAKPIKDHKKLFLTMIIKFFITFDLDQIAN